MDNAPAPAAVVVGALPKPRPRWLALAQAAWWFCAALALLVFLAAIPRGYVLLLQGARPAMAVDAPAWYVAGVQVAHGVVSMLTAVGCLALAGTLFWKKRAEPMALFASFYLLMHGILLSGPIEALDGLPLYNPGAPLPSGLLLSLYVLTQLQSAPFVLVLLIFYLFPDGRFVPRWTRYAALLALVLSPALVEAMSSTWPSTAGMTPWLWLALVVYTGLLAAGIYAQVVRYRRFAGPVERQQTKWVVFGLILSFAVSAALQIPSSFVAPAPFGSLQPWWAPLAELGWSAAMVILPLSFGLAVLRYRLWDVDVLIHRTLLYGLLTGSVIGLYTAVVVVLGRVFQATGDFAISLFATALVAVLFQPLRQRLQRAVDRLMYGERDDPYAVLSRLGQRLEATLAAEALLPAIVETLAQALKLPYAAVALREGEAFALAAESPPDPAGARRERVEIIPLTYQAEVVGQLRLAPRAPGESFSPADRRLLAHVAQQAGAAAHAVRLTRELQRSREHLVVLREEERRRIRRDLHDGLGPALASLAMQADAARDWTHTDPGRADAALADIAAQAQAALQDIRRLVYGLRPPALDELGLAGALRQAAANVSNGLHIDLDVPDALAPLPAAVEVAAYRIAQETLNNVVRHSGARNCSLRLSMQDDLTLEIRDDGMGLPPEVRAGVGLLSMRERAAELGGSCAIESVPGAGTRVTARLPLVTA